MAEGTQKKNYADGDCYKLMVSVVKNSEDSVRDAHMVMDMLQTHPELDKPLCLLFGIRPQLPPLK